MQFIGIGIRERSLSALGASAGDFAGAFSGGGSGGVSGGSLVGGGSVTGGGVCTIIGGGSSVAGGGSGSSVTGGGNGSCAAAGGSSVGVVVGAVAGSSVLIGGASVTVGTDPLGASVTGLELDASSELDAPSSDCWLGPLAFSLACSLEDLCGAGVLSRSSPRWGRMGSVSISKILFGSEAPESASSALAVPLSAPSSDAT